MYGVYRVTRLHGMLTSTKLLPPSKLYSKATELKLKEHNHSIHNNYYTRSLTDITLSIVSVNFVFYTNIIRMHTYYVLHTIIFADVFPALIAIGCDTKNFTYTGP